MMIGLDLSMLNKSEERRVRKAKGEIPRSQDKGRKPELQPTHKIIHRLF